MDEKYCFSDDFHLIQNGFQWLNEPTTPSKMKSGLLITMDSKKDFWRETYYKPKFIKDDGHFLFKKIPRDETIMIETEFDLIAHNQFDQAGIMVRVDEKHWIKTGIEYVDGNHKLSCVVTNTYSDWSTQSHKNGKLSIRLFKIDQSFVVEAKQGDDWNFIRICALDVTPKEDVLIGLFACSPTVDGGSVKFKYVKYQKVDGYHHSNKYNT